ncbi:transketolase [Chloroflexota bacterium]
MVEFQRWKFPELRNIMDGQHLQDQAINALRFLSADMVQNANSGHPGLPMGAAALAYTIWTRHLKHNPANPQWNNRDRFILSGGHGSALLYALLYLTGYDISLEDIKKFRQWGSLAAGHPEFGLTPGVEVTTGPLGQGFANGVGFAIVEKQLAAQFNREGFNIVDHHVFAIVTDGDLMEGVASEAASLAGHLRLGKLIYLYDDNHISIDGSTDLAFTEDRKARFNSYGWQTLIVQDGNDVEAIDKAIFEAKGDDRPSLILCRTQIGYGLPTRQGTSKAHGEPPGEDELNKAKINLGWPVEPWFEIPENVIAYYRNFRGKGKEWERNWSELFSKYQKNYPEKAKEFSRRFNKQLPDKWKKTLPEFQSDPVGVASRAASGIVLNSLARILPEITGGSADLAPSNVTWIENSPSFQSDTPAGRNFHFGVREHAMGAIVNGMAVHGGVIPYGATFLVFSDYMRGAIRLSALSKIQAIWIFTHDSIGLGEDGPTHQPIEHLASLRAIPGLSVIRPADANETRDAWIMAIERQNQPTALILSRQALPTMNHQSQSDPYGLCNGAYILEDLGEGEPEIILMATGSEVSLILQAGRQLNKEGINVRIVSFPSWDLFQQQSKEYQESIFPKQIMKRIAVEAGCSQGWKRWVGDKGVIISIDHYGASAPANILFKEFGFTVPNILEHAKRLINN